jgi:hypothetical protein
VLSRISVDGSCTCAWTAAAKHTSETSIASFVLFIVASRKKIPRNSLHGCHELGLLAAVSVSSTTGKQAQ